MVTGLRISEMGAGRVFEGGRLFPISPVPLLTCDVEFHILDPGKSGSACGQRAYLLVLFR